MLRRSHKKSRRGCLECKQRHVKCDEGRPQCFLCTMSGRVCSYASVAPPEHLTTLATPQTPIESPDRNHGDPGFPGPGFTPLATAPLYNRDSPLLPNLSNQSHDPILDEPLNLNHMELLIHITQGDDLFSTSYHLGTYLNNIATAFRIGLETPYLLEQMLAFSARHLAFLRPERSAFYLHQAVTFQTRAIALFNAAWSGVDKSNCVSMLLFSSILGHHVLADTLVRRDVGGLETFMSHFIQCVDMHMGIHTIADSAWPLLMESEIEPILSWSSGYTSRQPRGNHCQPIVELIDGSNDLEEEKKEACQAAIQYLQIGLDAVLADEKEEQGNKYHMIPTWPLLMTPEVRDLLAAKRPEALVILGYYALLLHHGRNLWQVGDAGAYVLRIIVDYLGPGWTHWLEYPVQSVAETLSK